MAIDDRLWWEDPLKWMIYDDLGSIWVHGSNVLLPSGKTNLAMENHYFQ